MSKVRNIFASSRLTFHKNQYGISRWLFCVLLLRKLTWTHVGGVYNCNPILDLGVNVEFVDNKDMHSKCHARLETVKTCVRNNVFCWGQCLEFCSPHLHSARNWLTRTYATHQVSGLLILFTVLSEEIPPTRLVRNIYIDLRSSVVYCCKGMLNLISIQPQVSEQYAISRAKHWNFRTFSIQSLATNSGCPLVRIKFRHP
jgi:hypothetical protein